jgi:hypothetical protein
MDSDWAYFGTALMRFRRPRVQVQIQMISVDHNSGMTRWLENKKMDVTWSPGLTIEPRRIISLV